jgi:hypothetical protein
MAVEGTGLGMDWENNGRCSQSIFSAVVTTAQAQDMFARCNLTHAIVNGAPRLVMPALEVCAMTIKNIANRSSAKMMKS